MKRNQGKVFLIEEYVGNADTNLIASMIQIYMDRWVPKTTQKLVILLDNCS